MGGEGAEFMNNTNFCAKKKKVSCREDSRLKETRKQLQFIGGKIPESFPYRASDHLQDLHQLNAVLPYERRGRNYLFSPLQFLITPTPLSLSDSAYLLQGSYVGDDPGAHNHFAQSLLLSVHFGNPGWTPTVPDSHGDSAETPRFCV